MVLPRIFELFFQWALSIKSQEREQDSTQGNEIHQSQQNPKHYSFIKLTHLIFLVIALWKWFVILLFFPINLLIGLVWVVIFGILVLISICCALISRWLIFLIELDASWRALRLLKQYN